MLVYRLAVMSLRMEHCVEYETATMASRADEILTDPTIKTDIERRHAIALARFDHSPESAAVRRYEAAASREFFKALRALQNHEPGDDQPQPARVAPVALSTTPIKKTASAELASSCKATSMPIPRDSKTYTQVELSPVDELTLSNETLKRVVFERLNPANPLNFAIGKPPGSRD